MNNIWRLNNYEGEKVWYSPEILKRIKKLIEEDSKIAIVYINDLLENK